MTTGNLVQVNGVPVLVWPPEGPPLRDEGDAIDLIGEALHRRAELVVLPAEQLPDDFFRLRTGIAGAIVQKFVNYRLRLAIVGDISRHLAGGTALRDFVYEANRGNQLWFVQSREELERRLVRM